MNTLLSKEERDYKENIEALTSNYIKKNKDLILKNLWQELYKNSFISSNNSFLQDVLLTEAVCKVEPGLGLFLLTQFTCIYILKNHGSEALKNKYVNELTSGNMIACFSITEPNAGSDVTMIETNAKEENDLWIINGHKIWASNGSISDVIICFAQAKEYKDKTGITCFLIPSLECEIFPDTPKLGVKITPSNEIKINNLKINKSLQIGNVGDGIKIALGAITLGRIFCAAQAIGLMTGSLSECINHAAQRNQFGRKIIDNQAIAWYIVDMVKDLDASRLLLYKAVWAKETNASELQKLSSMAKYFSTSRASLNASKAVQIFGGKGLIEDSYVAKAYRDAKVLEIYEGTNEIQKVILSRELSLN